MSYKINYQPYIKRSDLQINKGFIFVFGDNDQRSGFGGQAKEMRGEPNAIGIRVKKRPSLDTGSFYTEDLNHLEIISKNKIIVFPSSGIGTGFANLKISAPRTFDYLTSQLKQKFDIHNEY